MEIENADVFTLKSQELSSRLREEEQKGAEAARRNYEAQAKAVREKLLFERARQKHFDSGSGTGLADRLRLELHARSFRKLVAQKDILSIAKRKAAETKKQQDAQAERIALTKNRINKISEYTSNIKQRLLQKAAESEMEASMEIFINSRIRDGEKAKDRDEEFVKAGKDGPETGQRVPVFVHQNVLPSGFQSGLVCRDSLSGDKKRDSAEVAPGTIARKDSANEWSKALEEALGLDGSIDEVRSETANGVKGLSLSYKTSSGVKISMSVVESKGSKLVIVLTPESALGIDALNSEKTNMVKLLKERGLNIEKIEIGGKVKNDI